MKTHYVVILNDGTDEIFNLNGIAFTDLEDFKKQFRQILDRGITFKGYYLTKTEKQLDMILQISNKPGDHTDTEMLLLEILENAFFSWAKLKRRLNKLNT